MIPIRQLGKLGVIKDIDPSELAPEAWTDGNNFMCHNGSVTSVLADNIIVDSTATQVTPIFIDIFKASTGEWIWIYSDGTDIYGIKTDGSHVDVGTFTTTTGFKIQGTEFSGIYVINNGLDTPMFWDGDFGVTTFADLTAWPATNPVCDLIVSYKNFLVMLNVTESGDEFGKMVWWSDAADPGSIPTSWDYTSAAVLAGRQDVPGPGGNIKDAALLNDRLVVYRERATDMMNFVGGTFVFRFNNIFAAIGAKSIGSAVDIGGRHAVFTDEDLIIHDGSTYQSVVKRRLHEWLKASIDPANLENSFTIHVPKDNEVWFAFPEVGETYCTKAFSYNYETQETGIRELGKVASSAVGPYTFGSASDTWDGDSDPWDDDFSVWDATTSSNSNSLTFLARPTDDVISLAATAYTDAGGDISGFIERVDLQLPGSLEHDVIGVNEIAPSFANIGIPAGIELKFFVGTKMTSSGSYTWDGPHFFDTDTDYRITPIVVGRWFGIRLMWSLKGQMVFSSYEVGASKQGRYA